MAATPASLSVADLAPPAPSAPTALPMPSAPGAQPRQRVGYVANPFHVEEVSIDSLKARLGQSVGTSATMRREKEAYYALPVWMKTQRRQAQKTTTLPPLPEDIALAKAQAEIQAAVSEAKDDAVAVLHAHVKTAGGAPKFMRHVRPPVSYPTFNILPPSKVAELDMRRKRLRQLTKLSDGALSASATTAVLEAERKAIDAFNRANTEDARLDSLIQRVEELKGEYVKERERLKQLESKLWGIWVCRRFVERIYAGDIMWQSGDGAKPLDWIYNVIPTREKQERFLTGMVPVFDDSAFVCRRDMTPDLAASFTHPSPPPSYIGMTPRGGEGQAWAKKMSGTGNTVPISIQSPFIGGINNTNTSTNTNANINNSNSNSISTSLGVSITNTAGVAANQQGETWRPTAAGHDDTVSTAHSTSAADDLDTIRVAFKEFSDSFSFLDWFVANTTGDKVRAITYDAAAQSVSDYLFDEEGIKAMWAIWTSLEQKHKVVAPRPSTPLLAGYFSSYTLPSDMARRNRHVAKRGFGETQSPRGGSGGSADSGPCVCVANDFNITTARNGRMARIFGDSETNSLGGGGGMGLGATPVEMLLMKHHIPAVFPPPVVSLIRRLLYARLLAVRTRSYAVFSEVLRAPLPKPYNHVAVQPPTDPAVCSAIRLALLNLDPIGPAALIEGGLVVESIVKNITDLEDTVLRSTVDGFEDSAQATGCGIMESEGSGAQAPLSGMGGGSRTGRGDSLEALNEYYDSQLADVMQNCSALTAKIYAASGAASADGDAESLKEQIRLAESEHDALCLLIREAQYISQHVRMPWDQTHPRRQPKLSKMPKGRTQSQGEQDSVLALQDLGSEDEPERHAAGGVSVSVGGIGNGNTGSGNGGGGGGSGAGVGAGGVVDITSVNDERREALESIEKQLLAGVSQFDMNLLISPKTIKDRGNPTLIASEAKLIKARELLGDIERRQKELAATLASIPPVQRQQLEKEREGERREILRFEKQCDVELCRQYRVALVIKRANSSPETLAKLKELKSRRPIPRSFANPIRKKAKKTRQNTKDEKEVETFNFYDL